jgi:nucleotide-binding universal stress UspA family protein
MFQPRVLLHPTDYSDCARYAYEVALDLASHHHARLLLLHVAETLGPETVSHGEALHERQPAGHFEHLRQQLHQFAPSRPDVAVEHLLAEGTPGPVIAKIAQDHHCDLIVMGTYGRSALSRLLTGSVTQKVTQLAHCAILTVRMPGSHDAIQRA